MAVVFVPPTAADPFDIRSTFNSSNKDSIVYLLFTFSSAYSDPFWIMVGLPGVLALLLANVYLPKVISILLPSF